MQARWRSRIAGAFAAIALSAQPVLADSGGRSQQKFRGFEQSDSNRQSQRSDSRDKNNDKSDSSDKSSKNDKNDKNDKSDKSDKSDQDDKTSDKSDNGSAAGDAKKSAKKSDSGSKDKSDSSDSDPPQTVAEMFKRWAKAALKDDAGKADKKDGSEKAATPSSPKSPVAGATQKAAPAPRGKVGPIVDLPALPFARPEFLASKLPADALKRLAPLGFTPNGSVTLPKAGVSWTRLLVPPNMSVDDAYDLLKAQVPVAEFDLNKKYRIFKPANAPTDLRIEETRSARTMNTSCGTDRCFATDVTGWKQGLSACATGVKIGLVDTGYDEAHAALRDQRGSIVQRRFAKGATAPNWHGTGVLALLAGKDATETPGLVPRSRFLVADIFYGDTDGQPASDTASLAEAIDWLATQGAHIINMSLAGPADGLLETVIERVSRSGIIFIAAAGNDGPASQPRYPAAYKPVIAVTAIGSAMQNYRHAVRGDHIDLAAPGMEIWTAMPGNKGAYHSGTSFAAPYVTAIIASMYPSLPNKSKEAIIASMIARMQVKDLGEPGRDPIFGHGLALAPAACGANVATVPGGAVAKAADWSTTSSPARATPPAGPKSSTSFMPSADR